MEYTGKTRFFSVLARDGGARSGRVRTDHGACDTPCFLPIASDGGLRALSFGQARECGTRMVMANAWYVYRKAGPEVLERAGGAHGHIGWSGALFTDSGGYQVFSLRDNSKIGRDGVSFGEEALTPESVIEMQTRVGADIMSVLDDCAPFPAGRRRIEDAVKRTTRWARRCQAAHERIGRRYDYGQVLYGIVQGGAHGGLRRRSIQEVAALDFGGYGIGGLSIGMPRAAIREMTALTCEGLPDDRPRHLLGVGLPGQVLEGIEDGADTFDCVLPVRKGQRGIAYTRRGEVRYKAPQPDRLRDAPLDEACTCATCQRHSREALRLLFKSDKPRAGQLAAQHNIHFYHQIMAEARAAIGAGRFAAYKTGFLQKWDAGEEGAPGPPAQRRPQVERPREGGIKRKKAKPAEAAIGAASAQAESAKTEKDPGHAAIAHIKATANNTLVTITDPGGNVLCWASAGSCGFAGSRRSTVFAGRAVATKAGEEAVRRGVREVEVRAKGAGDGLEGAIGGLEALGLSVRRSR